MSTKHSKEWLILLNEPFQNQHNYYWDSFFSVRLSLPNQLPNRSISQFCVHSFFVFFFRIQNYPR